MNRLHFQYFLNFILPIEKKRDVLAYSLFSFLIGGLLGHLEQRANGEEGENAGQVEQDRGDGDWQRVGEQETQVAPRHYPSLQNKE
jgi:hypothetical protein